MKKITVILLSVLVVLLIIYDVVIYIKGGPSATISHVIWNASGEYRIIPFFTGFLMGHLFWQNKHRS